jgi:hypothetical protein
MDNDRTPRSGQTFSQAQIAFLIRLAEEHKEPELEAILRALYAPKGQTLTSQDRSTFIDSLKDRLRYGPNDEYSIPARELLHELNAIAAGPSVGESMPEIKQGSKLYVSWGYGEVIFIRWDGDRAYCQSNNGGYVYIPAAIMVEALKSAEAAKTSDPLDTPLPCDITVGAGTMRKGVKLKTLVARMQVLHKMAMYGKTGIDADVLMRRALDGGHLLYTDGDKNRPDEICSANGLVALSLCKLCGKAEAELEAACTPSIHTVIGLVERLTPFAIDTVVMAYCADEGKYAPVTGFIYDAATNTIELGTMD